MWMSSTGEAFWSKLTHSANPREECRLIVLGGDNSAKNQACSFILRKEQSQEISDLEEWKVMENCVQGRQVTVVNSPSSWLKHLSSFFFSRRVKTLKADIEKCVSVAFPGPHAFLLVIRDGSKPGKAHCLLKAIASVFGEEALEYSMVLFFAGSGGQHSDPVSVNCVKKCGNRHHILENSESSVQELFSKVEAMGAKQKSKFFIPSAYTNTMKAEFELWEKKRILHIKELLDENDKHIKELKIKLDASKLRESEPNEKLDTARNIELILRKELDTYHLRESEIKKELDTYYLRESEMKKKLNTYHLRESELYRELDASRSNEQVLRNKLHTFQQREDQLIMELNASQQGERNLKMKLDDYEIKESKLRKHLEASNVREHKLRKECDALQKSERELKTKLDAFQLRESEVKKELEDTQVKENKLIKESDDDSGMKGDSKEQELQLTTGKNCIIILYFKAIFINLTNMNLTIILNYIILIIINKLIIIILNSLSFRQIYS